MAATHDHALEASHSGVRKFPDTTTLRALAGPIAGNGSPPGPAFSWRFGLRVTAVALSGLVADQYQVVELLLQVVGR